MRTFASSMTIQPARTIDGRPGRPTKSQEGPINIGMNRSRRGVDRAQDDGQLAARWVVAADEADDRAEGRAGGPTPSEPKGTTPRARRGCPRSRPRRGVASSTCPTTCTIGSGSRPASVARPSRRSPPRSSTATCCGPAAVPSVPARSIAAPSRPGGLAGISRDRFEERTRSSREGMGAKAGPEKATARGFRTPAGPGMAVDLQAGAREQPDQPLRAPHRDRIAQDPQL